MQSSLTRRNSGKEKTKEKITNIVKRLRLKRQTKLLCTLNERWNNYEDLTKYG